MGDLPPEVISGIIGVIMMLAISIVKRPEWPNWMKVVLTGVFSLGVGSLSAFLSGDIPLEWTGDLARIFTSACAAFTAATTIYNAWFKNTTWDTTLMKFPLK